MEGNWQVTGKGGLGAAEPAFLFWGCTREETVAGHLGVRRRVGDECILLHGTLKIKCSDDRLFRAA